MGKYNGNNGYIGSDFRLKSTGSISLEKHYLSRYQPTLAFDSPASIPGLYAWWDADFGVTVTGGTTVTSWEDKYSGKILSGVNQPQYTNAINGQSTITFDGSDDYLRGNSFTLGSNYTHFFVWNSRDTTNKVSFAFQPANVIIYNYSATSFSNYAGNGQVDHFNYTAGTPGLLITTNNDPNNLFTSKYNGDFQSKEKGSTITNNNIMIADYQYGGSSYDSNMDVAEWILYTRTLADTEIGNVELYLKTKYNISY